MAKEWKSNSALEKKAWSLPHLEMLELKETAETKVWSFVQSGDFWKRQEITLSS